MPQMANIVVNDASAQPMTFVPFDSRVVPAFVSKGLTPLADRILQVSLREPSGKDSVYKSVITLAVPVTVDETVNGVTRTTIQRVNRAKIEFMMSPTSTQSERDDLVAIVKNVLADATVDSVVTDLLPYY